MGDNDFGVPAGWYPDPLGLPQLRWWDAQAWTEHTSEARAPIVIQPSTATDTAAIDLPSRREQRERERRENGDLLEAERETELRVPSIVEVTPAEPEEDELSAQPLLAMTLRELEPPLEENLDDATPGPRRASFHANAAPAASTLSAYAEEVAPERELKKAKTYTGAVIVIALMPALQAILLAVMVMVLGVGQNVPLMLTVVIAPYLVVLGFAFYDRLLLQVWGHERPASAFWALLAQPGYLIARAVATIKENGKGFAPIALFGSALVGALVTVLIVPGIVVGMLPQVFSDEVEQSVQADAAALGATLTLDCPAPPVIIGETFSCVATKPSGATDSIAVSLQRENGWVAWRVEDWGLWVVTAP